MNETEQTPGQFSYQKAAANDMQLFEDHRVPRPRLVTDYLTEQARQQVAATETPKPAPPWKPLGNWLYVRLLDAPKETASGIALPERHQENYCDAWVLAVGPGRYYPETGLSALLEPSEGDRVLFPFHALKPTRDDPRCGFVLETDCIAVLRMPQYELEPLQDWVLVDQPVTEESVSEGGIVLPEVARQASRWGLARDWGVGRLIERGPVAGTRRPLLFPLPATRPAGGWFVSPKVYWDGAAENYCVDGPDGGTLLRFTDLVAIEDQGEEAVTP